MNQVVLGCGFGDEGKGLVTSYLCANTNNPLVVRFNGGHQAGHTVVHNEKRHVFSSFGSGTLQGVPTYWSKNCTLYPVGFLNEWKVIRKLGIVPSIFVHPLCPITTPMEVAANRKYEAIYQNGTVGVGFGETLQREADHFHLYAQDLFYPSVLAIKLAKIADYRRLTFLAKGEIDKFIGECTEVSELISLQDDSIINGYNVIFEGAQGILLDQEFGFFPNVTRSYTTTRNIWEMMKGITATEINYVTRCYQTRHGAGPMTNQKLPLTLKNNEQETNQSAGYQGEFRTSPLDLDLLNYSLRCDSNYSNSQYVKRNLVLTCADQVEKEFTVTRNGSAFKTTIWGLREHIDVQFENVYVSYGPTINHIIKLE